jgi:hypothetical protein
MKRRFLLAAAALCTAPSASAQLTLHDFSAFVSPNTFFVDDWELTGDPVGTNSPRATFSQGAGFYNFVGGNNAASASAFYFFAVPLDISGLSLLQISAAQLAANTAPSFDIKLFDLNGNVASAVFLTAAFAGPGFTTVTASLDFTGFDSTQLAYFQITGNVLGGTDTLNVALDHLAVAPRDVGTPVPEPATYGAAAALLLIVLTGIARFSRHRNVT